MSQPNDSCETLSADERRILQVFSVVYEPVNQTTLQRILKTLGWRDAEGRPLADLMAKPLRERLLALGCLVEMKSGLTCVSRLVEPLTRETVNAGCFQEIVTAGEQVVSSVPPLGWRDTQSYRSTRRLRNALYAGREEEVLRMIGVHARKPGDRIPFSAVATLTQVCTLSPDPTWLATLAPRLRVLALGPALVEVGYELTPDPDLVALACEHLTPLLDDQPEAAVMLAEHYLLEGRPDQAAPILAERITPDALPLIGWLHFIQGRYDEALGVFDLHLTTQRRQTRKRNIYVPGLAGVFHLLALLRRGTAEDLQSVQRQVSIALRAPVTDRFESLFRILDELAGLLMGRLRFYEAVWIRRPLRDGHPYEGLFQALALHWLGEQPEADMVDELARYHDLAVEAGVLWYAWESADMLRALGRQVDAEALPARPEEVHGLTRLLAPKSQWEIALEALKGLAASDEGAAAGESSAPDRRMAWVLSLYGSEGQLEPREQKRTKRGGWTQGRPVALARLAESPQEFDYLTDADQRILATMTQEHEQGWYGNYGRVYYRLDGERALLAAVGHPRIFRPGVMDAPLELVPGGPALEVIKRKSDILMRLNPFPPVESDLLIQDDGPQRLRLVRFDASHRRIAKLVGMDGLKVPSSGKDKVLESIAAVAPLLTVHSAIGGTERIAETLESDARPHVQLNPVDEGLALELFMQPLGDKGPRVHPGQGMANLFAEVDGRAVQTTRDLAGERRAATAVLNACPALAGQDGWIWTLESTEDALTALEQLHALGDAVVLQWPEGKRIGLSSTAQIGSMRVSVGKQRDWLGLDGELALDDGRVLGMRQLLELIQASPGRFIRLGEREFVALSEELRRRLENLAGLTERGRFHPLAAAAIEESLEGMEVQRSAHWKATLKRLEEVRELEPELPSTLQAELRDYQLEGFRWLARLAHWGAGACLADDMGLGKTLQALAVILSRATEGPTLVLAPMSVCANWMTEASRFAPTLQPKRFGAGDRAQMLNDAGPFDLIISSYGLLQTEAERLAAVPWATVVADEAQAFKNANTKRSQAIMKLDAGFRMITTGTPIENHLGELWNLFRFINPGLLGSLETFNERFAIPIEQHRDSGARKRLRQLLRPFILRRLKSDVLSELPPRTEITLELELGAAESALYEALRRQAMERLESEDDHPGHKRIQLLAEIMRLRRACCHPKLVLPDSELASAKLDAFGDILDDLLDNRHKALVFSQFVDHLSLIRTYLDGRGISYQYLDGSTSESKRKAAVAAFQAGEGDLFLISLRAGGSGLNLTAADYVIHMDPWWNPAVEDQASDRAHRIGQERPVTIYRLVTKGTIEQKILALHAAKRDLADELLEGAGDSGRLGYEEMLALIRDSAS
ncbi:DEAD/DEAH box helicase [Thiorhodococcus mannitoliphagus]|uniref:DEAD/DEAH box helicase n=1 Tax=Thiorhodococcus mannitoliphagus TaxID=329406 RepID=A0A6P1DYV8_9GAMM|nr:DEAD/DEAH box helicase [Thiorhodococcus mannitoliphagus]NEX21906.1 DEAD/DEAH box helicase [Thiorhodococcus mannitoliphagus]